MSSAILDIATLLLPISTDQPAGIDIRTSPTTQQLYYKIKDARLAARYIERSAADDQAPDWSVLVTDCFTVIRKHSKDIEIAAWACEGLVRTDGFAGLNAGLCLIAGLIEQFWDILYPLPDEDGMLVRMSAMIGLNGEGAEGTLIQAIRRINLTSGTGSAYGLWQYIITQDIARISDAGKREARINSGAITIEQFNMSVSQTPAVFYTTIIADIKAAIATHDIITTRLKELMGDNAPAANQISDILEQCLTAINHFAADKLPTISAAIGTSIDAAGDGKIEIFTGLTGRAEALQSLTKIAAFFRISEPHSPLAYTLEEAVRRGNMTLPDLLSELLPEQSARNQFLMAAGIRCLSSTNNI